ncbi:MAG: tetratricopeptide repeat protein [Blastocatellia bacterium]|nr:tetratricopeptide repeat protein [Blastocatellia bacterium]
MSVSREQILLEEGLTALENGEVATARMKLLEVTDLNPRNEVAWVWLSQITDSARGKIAYLRRAHEIKPEDGKIGEALKVTMVQEAIVLAKAGNAEKAHELLEQALEIDPTYELAWLWLASTSHSTQEQIAHLETVLTINPKHAEAQQLLAKLRAEHPGGIPAGPPPAKQATAVPLLPAPPKPQLRLEPTPRPQRPHPSPAAVQPAASPQAARKPIVPTQPVSPPQTVVDSHLAALAVPPVAVASVSLDSFPPEKQSSGPPPSTPPASAPAPAAGSNGWLKIAAGLIILLLVGGIGWNMTSRPQGSPASSGTASAGDPQSASEAPSTQASKITVPVKSEVAATPTEPAPAGVPTSRSNQAGTAPTAKKEEVALKAGKEKASRSAKPEAGADDEDSPFLRAH